MDTVEARVARGAAWLDEHQPGWERRIDLAKLALDETCRCVLGQVMPEHNYYETLYRIDVGWEWSAQHGFSGGFDSDVWQVLDEVWISLIKERFDTGNLSDETR